MDRRLLIEAQRAGYVAGLRASTKSKHRKWNAALDEAAALEAARVFPLTATRPRTITIVECEYQVRVDGQLWSRYLRPTGTRLCGNNGTVQRLKAWSDWRPCPRTRAQMQALLDLFDHPTEEVSL